LRILRHISGGQGREAAPQGRVHAGRAAGGDRHHRHPHRPAASRRPEGPRVGGPDPAFPNGGKNGLDAPVNPTLAALYAQNPTKYQGYDSAPWDRSEWSWTYQILPFIEQANLYHTKSDATVHKTPVHIYYCPTRRSVQVYNNNAKVDYAGNAGTNGSTGANGVCVRAGTGVVRLTDVKDGASNTVMVGEKRLNAALFGQTYDDNEACYSPGWDSEIWRIAVTVNGVPQPPLPDLNTPNPPGQADPLSGSDYFGSAHAVGVNVIMCDGAVRFVSYGVNGTVFRFACQRNDGKTFNLGDL
jgi:hypothetical protein